MPLLFSFFLLSATLFSAAPLLAAGAPFHSCTPPPSVHDHEQAIPCPPFRSPPASFPFASLPGCGHPSFQIRCSVPHSVLFIGATRFLLLDLGSSSVVLSPVLPLPNSSTCPSLPSAPFDLSSSPFHPSAAACRRLAALRPCRSLPPLLSYSTGDSSCELSPWQLRLLSRPHLLFSDCSSATATACHPDSAPAIANFLRSGVRLEWGPSDPYFANCSACSGVCGFNESAAGKPFLCFPGSTDNLHRRRIGSADPRRLLLLSTVLFTVAVFFILLLLLAFWGAASLRRGGASDPASDPTAAFLLRHQLQHPVYTYDELRAATGGFDPRRKIGDGGFGSVYLACLDDGRVAAVKRLHRHHPLAAASKSFCNEVLILSSLRHPNLVRLHGYCCDPRGLVLVYDYVPNGTLADHLHGPRRHHGNPALIWAIRVNIALQIATALEYLHFTLKPPVVHRDITSSNIFIERDMKVKLGDFGLSRLLSLPDSSSASGLSSEYVCCTGPQGTPGYLDPEYHQSFRLTEKSDVYSFGVVLLELVTGMKAVDVRRDRSEVALVDLVVSRIHIGALHKVVDPVLLKEGKEAMPMVEAMSELAFRCVAGDKDDRPNARELVQELQRVRAHINDNPKGS